MGDPEYIAAFQQIVMPIAYEVRNRNQVSTGTEPVLVPNSEDTCTIFVYKTTEFWAKTDISLV